MQEYYPAVGGMPEVVKQLSERLVQMGHSVTVVTSANVLRKSGTHNGVKIVSFSITGNLVSGFSGDTKVYEDFLLASDFDIVTLFAAQQWTVDLALPLLSKIKGKKVFVPTGFSYLYDAKYDAYYEKMKAWMKEFDANVFLSEDYRDINFAKANGITKNFLIPNAAAEEEFEKTESINIRQQLGVEENKFLILHVGGFTGAKGQKEAIQIFLDAKIGNAVLLLVGNGNSLLKKVFHSHHRYFGMNVKRILKGKKIIIRELGRAETVAAFKSADMFLFPSNIECSPIVLFEAMASSTPFLSSDAGNAAEIVKWSGAGQILPTEKNEIGWGKIKIKESAKMLEDFVADKKRLNEMGRKGFEAWKKRFTWSKIARQYEELYLSLKQ